MIIKINSDGTVINTLPEIVVQGSINVNTIRVVAPFSQSVSATIKFTLPNGYVTGILPMDAHAFSPDDKVGIWSIPLTQPITQYSGSVQFTVSFSSLSSGVGQVLPVVHSSFNVQKASTPELPLEPTPDVYDLILAKLGSFDTLKANWINAKDVPETIEYDEAGLKSDGIFYNYENGDLKGLLIVSRFTEEGEEPEELIGVQLEYLFSPEGLAEREIRYNLDTMDIIDTTEWEIKPEVIDSLDSTNTDKALSANKGRVLDEIKVDKVLDYILTTLSDEQEIYINDNGEPKKTTVGDLKDYISISGIESSFVNATFSQNTLTFTRYDGNTLNVILNETLSGFVNDLNFQTDSDVDDTVAQLLESVTYNSLTGVLTFDRRDGDPIEIDLPLELIIESGTYDEETQEIVLVLANEDEIKIPVGDLVDEYYADNITIEKFVDEQDDNKRKFRLTSEYKDKVDNALSKADIGPQTVAGDITFNGTVIADDLAYSGSTVKDALNTLDDTKVNKAGDTITGAIDMGSNKITSSYTPVDSVDLTNKEYVDTSISSHNIAADAHSARFDAKMAKADYLDINDKVKLDKLPDITKQPTKVFATTEDFNNFDTTEIIAGTKAFDNEAKNAYVWDSNEWLLTSDADWENINLDWTNINNAPTNNAEESLANKKIYDKDEADALLDLKLEEVDISNKVEQSDIDVSITAHDTSETAHDDIRIEISALSSQVSGKSKAIVFDTKAQLDNWLAGNEPSFDKQPEDLNIGDQFYIREEDTPDYWWDGEKIVIETNKVDLADYDTSAEVDTKITSHNTSETAHDDIRTELDLKLEASDIEDSLESTSTTNALSANQGRVLDEKIGDMINKTIKLTLPQTDWDGTGQLNLSVAGTLIEDYTPEEVILTLTYDRNYRQEFIDSEIWLDVYSDGALVFKAEDEEPTQDIDVIIQVQFVKESE